MKIEYDPGTKRANRKERRGNLAKNRVAMRKFKKDRGSSIAPEQTDGKLHPEAAGTVQAGERT